MRSMTLHSLSWSEHRVCSKYAATKDVTNTTTYMLHMCICRGTKEKGFLLQGGGGEVSLIAQKKRCERDPEQKVMGDGEGGKASDGEKNQRHG